MITAVPVVTPVTTPDADPTEAMPGEPESHIPPVAVSTSAVVVPEHVVKVPVMGEGAGLIVTGKVTEQPANIVYEMVTAPAEMPVTIPVEPTAATPDAPELHVPPDIASASVIDAPMQILLLPGPLI